MKLAIIILSDPTHGGEEALGRLFNGLATAADAVRAGDDVVIAFAGAGTRWPEELTKLGHPARALYESVRERVTGASCGCSEVFGARGGVEACGVPLLTDVHEYTPFDDVAAVVDVLQTPAFLCRQTDFIQAVARTMKPVNIKKGQFLAPWDMKHVVEKARAVGNEQIMVCERGASFGYNNLVSDMRSLVVMRETRCPVVFDATHSVQLPGGQGASSGGQREFVPALSRAAVAVGVAGLFMETHPDPDKALSDGPNAWPLGKMRALLETLMAIDRAVKSTDIG